MFLLRAVLASLAQCLLTNAFGLDEVLKHAFKMQKPFFKDLENMTDNMMPSSGDMSSVDSMMPPGFGNMSSIAEAEKSVMKDMSSELIKNVSQVEKSLLKGMGSIGETMEGGFGGLLSNASSFGDGAKVMEASKEIVSELGGHGNRTREVSMSDSCACEEACDVRGKCKKECKENGKVVESCPGLEVENKADPAESRPDAKDFRLLTSGRKFLARV